MLTYSRNIFDPAEAFETIFRSLANTPKGVLPVRIREDNDGFIAEAVLPGVPSDAIDITVRGNELALAIRAQRPVESEADDTDASGDSQAAGETAIFAQRIIRLPAEVDQTRIEADLKLGVLTLRLPRAESALPRRIEIRSTNAE